MGTKQEAIEYFEKIGLPVFFKKIYLGELKESDVTIFAGCPEEFFMMTSMEQEEYSIGVLEPVIDNGNFDSIIYHDPENDRFVELSVDDPLTKLNEYENYNQIFFEILCRAHEALDTEDELVQLCKDMGVVSYVDWLNFLNQTIEDSYDEFTVKKQSFKAGIT